MEGGRYSSGQRHAEGGSDRTIYECRLIGRLTEAVLQFFNENGSPYRSVTTGPIPSTVPPYNGHCRTCRCFRGLEVPVVAVSPYYVEEPSNTPLEEDTPRFPDDGMRADESAVGVSERPDFSDGPEGRWLVEANNGSVVVTSDDAFDISSTEEDIREVVDGFLNEHRDCLQSTEDPPRGRYSRPESDYSPQHSPTPGSRPVANYSQSDDGIPSRRTSVRSKRRARSPAYRRFNTSSTSDEGDESPISRKRRRIIGPGNSRLGTSSSPVPSTSTGGGASSSRIPGDMMPRREATSDSE